MASARAWTARTTTGRDARITYRVTNRAAAVLEPETHGRTRWLLSANPSAVVKRLVDEWDRIVPARTNRLNNKKSRTPILRPRRRCTRSIGIRVDTCFTNGPDEFGDGVAKRARQYWWTHYSPIQESASCLGQTHALARVITRSGPRK